MKGLVTIRGWAGVILFAAAMSGTSAGAALAQVDYSYVGPTFDIVFAPYTTSDRVSGSFTVAAPLPPNLLYSDISGLVIAFSFTDGVATRTEADSVVCEFIATTDGSGVLLDSRFWLRESGVPLNDPQHNLERYDLGGYIVSQADPCAGGGLAPYGTTDGYTTAGEWTSPRAVPAAGRGALLGLALLLVTAGAVRLKW